MSYFLTRLCPVSVPQCVRRPCVPCPPCATYVSCNRFYTPLPSVCSRLCTPCNRPCTPYPDLCKSKKRDKLSDFGNSAPSLDNSNVKKGSVRVSKSKKERKRNRNKKKSPGGDKQKPSESKKSPTKKKEKIPRSSVGSTNNSSVSEDHVDKVPHRKNNKKESKGSVGNKKQSLVSEGKDDGSYGTNIPSQTFGVGDNVIDPERSSRNTEDKDVKIPGEEHPKGSGCTPRPCTPRTVNYGLRPPCRCRQRNAYTNQNIPGLCTLRVRFNEYPRPTIAGNESRQPSRCSRCGNTKLSKSLPSNPILETVVTCGTCGGPKRVRSFPPSNKTKLNGSACQTNPTTENIHKRCVIKSKYEKKRRICPCGCGKKLCTRPSEIVSVRTSDSQELFYHLSDFCNV